MKKYIYTFFAVAAVLSSCSKSLEPNGDINSGAKAITTIGASTEISTRAVVSSSDDTKVNWETGDQLGVLGANGSSEARNLAYTLDGVGGSTTGTFKNGDSDISAISAVMYPYQASASWDGTNGGKLTCEIPSVQKATVGSFDKAAAIMYSTGNTTNVQLNYAVNFLKVTVSETNVLAISISSSNALSGKMEISSTGVTAASDGSLKGVTLSAGDGYALKTGAYYIAVKAGNIENPTISYIYLDRAYHTATEKTKAGSGTLTFTSGKNVRTISVADWSGATERKAFQLWENGPYFAEYNVGASSATDKGDMMTYTEATAENFTWGPNWCTPSKEQMDELLKAATSEGSTELYCNYTSVNEVYGFIFTNKDPGYHSNSVFFPAQDGGDNGGDAYYWSATANGSGAWNMHLYYYYYFGGWLSDWKSIYQGGEFRVRPVLKN